jgi:HNH endonuclease
MVKYLPIAEFHPYFAGDDGHIYRALKDKRSPHFPMKKVGHQTGYGYVCVILTHRDYEPFQTSAHALVCKTFHGQKPSDDYEVRHLNGIKTDNRPSNLAWGTRLENSHDKIRHGTSNKGITNGRAKLTLVDVVKIRKLREHGHTLDYIADAFSVSRSNVRCIVTRETWPDV